MVKKNIDVLYKEIRKLEKELISGRLKFFGERPFGNANKYIVILNNKRYFVINIGTFEIPKFKKSQILYIDKTIQYRDPENSIYNGRDYYNSDCGFIRFDSIYEHSKYNEDKIKKYKKNYPGELYTGCWE